MIKLALGSGKRFYGEDWIHIDNAIFPHTVQWNIFDLPCQNVDVIYACHLIAYFDREEIKPLLKHWFDILKPGGVLRIATPDWDAISSLYEPLLGPLYGKMKVNDQWIYHKTVWNYGDLHKQLKDVGFSWIKYYDHTKTDHAQIDDHSAAYYHGTLISLNIEAIK